MIHLIQKALKNHHPSPIGQQKKYSVLLPIVEVENELHLLYEVRSQSITQPGETSFPGGRLERGESFEEAAVRETSEELNIPTPSIEIYGELDYIVNPYQVIRSYVGKLHQIDLQDLRPNQEVERVFTLPISYLLDNAPEHFKVNITEELHKDFPVEKIPNSFAYRNHIKKTRDVPFYNLRHESLWGYTAQFTHAFINLLKEYS